jgi:DNA-directed RNA polymerase subunit K/omega
MALTDSRSRLSMIVARRAAQLKGGIPTTLDAEEMPEAGQNTV